MNEINAIRKLLEPYFEKYICNDDAEDIKEWLTRIETRLAEYETED